MTTRFDLHGLTHERLVDVVREGVGAQSLAPRSDLSPSLYRRNPDVPALRIQTYPKRRPSSRNRDWQGTGPAATENPAYQDFLVGENAPATRNLETA